MNKIVIVLTVLLSACGASPLENVNSDNDDVSIALIAKIENCNLYRVKDGYSETVYAVICPSSADFTSWDHSCGKNCVKKELVVTERKRNENTRSSSRTSCKDWS